MAARTISVQCAIAGGGPAGMVLGYLLARAGVKVLVMEKHADFLRDFRGDTLHPSTLQVMHQLGLLKALLRRPHQKARTLHAFVGRTRFKVADFSHLPTVCKYIVLMPQWHFLNFLAVRAQKLPTFTLLMNTEATALTRRGNAVTGLTARTPRGKLTVRAALTVAADGRHSTLRPAARLRVKSLGAPMDVLWMAVPAHESDPPESTGVFLPGRILALIYRGAYWQCAYVIPKGGAQAVHARGLPAFRKALADAVPMFKDRVGTLKNWDQVKLLTVSVDRLHRWSKPGFLCIGDAAHAMSPVGGVGINLAVQDAVAAANLLARPLAQGALTPARLAAVQRRRAFPTRVTQALQVFVQRRVIRTLLETPSAATLQPPLILRLVQTFPFLTRLPARLVGLGIRPESVSPALQALFTRRG